MNRPHPRRAAAATAALLLALTASCSGDQDAYPVTGKVTYRGQPAEGALVIFHLRGPAGITFPKPTGIVGADGQYALEIPVRDGAFPGEYAVTVTWLDKPKEPAGGKQPAAGAFQIPSEKRETPDRLGGRYRDPDKSKFVFKVEKKSNEMPPIELD